MDNRDPELDELEAIYDALDAGETEQALVLAREAMGRGGSDDPVVRHLAGIALLELDRAAEAVREFRQAVALDPEDGEFRANLALALFRKLDLEAADNESREALRTSPDLPDALYVRGLIVERSGDRVRADELFVKAHELDPDAFPRPVRLDEPAFRASLEAAAERLPEKFRRPLDEVVVTVEPLPTEEVLRDDPSAPFDPELMGLFVGVPLSERGDLPASGELPPRILIFQRNLERLFSDHDRLEEEIARTLYHELGHYLGLDEDELAAIDLD
jgi:predicted Zn-dependent protease with MMP-like domain